VIVIRRKSVAYRYARSTGPGRLVRPGPLSLLWFILRAELNETFPIRTIVIDVCL
jgi:hypothetical protein